MASARKKAALYNMVLTAQGSVVQDWKKLTPVYDTFMSVPNYDAHPLKACSRRHGACML